MEQTKTSLIREIHNLTDYTIKEIEEVYNQTFLKYPNQQAKYYARKAAIKRLQWWLVSLRKTKWLQKP